MNRKNNLIKKLAIGICAALAITSVIGWREPTGITRAAVDVGSGGLKVTIAKVDPLSQKIHKILSSKEVPLPLKRDMQIGGKSKFSEEVQETALYTIATLQEELSNHKPKEWKGIATAASRQAKNAQEMYDKIEEELGVKISIISQNEEGRLGFTTAVSVSGVPQEKLISFDSGSGSFQLTTLLDGQLEIIEGNLGHIPSLEALMKLRGQKLDHSEALEPLTFEEAVSLVQTFQKRLPPLSDAFAEKLKDSSNTVVGIGNEGFVFARAAKAIGKNTYTTEDLWKAIEANTTGELPSKVKSESVLGMVLLYAIMDGMGIDKLTYCYANGSCEGLLVDPTYWESSGT